MSLDFSKLTAALQANTDAIVAVAAYVKTLQAPVDNTAAQATIDGAAAVVAQGTATLAALEPAPVVAPAA